MRLALYLLYLIHDIVSLMHLIYGQDTSSTVAASCVDLLPATCLHDVHVIYL